VQVAKNGYALKSLPEVAADRTIELDRSP